MLLQDIHFRFKDTNMPKIKGWKKIYTMQTFTKRQLEWLILISDKTDFKIKIVTNNKGHFMVLKHQEDFIYKINIYTHI